MNNAEDALLLIVVFLAIVWLFRRPLGAALGVVL